MLQAQQTKQREEDRLRAKEEAMKGWTEHQTSDGRRYFFHQEKGESSWEKPVELRNAVEKKIEKDTDWKEYRIWDGREFYYNSKTKVSCWSVPPEVKKLRQEMDEDAGTGLPSEEIREKFVLAERGRAFHKLLQSAGVNGEWTWSKALQEVVTGAPEAEGLSERQMKQTFMEVCSFVEQRKELEAKEKTRVGKEELSKLITNWFAKEEGEGRPPDLAMRYEEISRVLGQEQAWEAVEEVERMEIFQKTMEQLEEKERHKKEREGFDVVLRLQRIYASHPKLKDHAATTRWKDVCAILEGNETFKDADKLTALKVWEVHREMAQSLPPPGGVVDPALAQDAAAETKKEGFLTGTKRKAYKCRLAFKEFLEKSAPKAPKLQKGVRFSELKRIIPAEEGPQRGKNRAFQVLDDLDRLPTGSRPDELLEEILEGLEIKGLLLPPPPPEGNEAPPELAAAEEEDDPFAAAFK